MILIEKMVEIGNLFDIYGKLLSERQYSVIEMYYFHNLSLQEIGEELKISRQGVFDTLKRAEKKLYDYESVLELGKRLNVYKIEIEKIRDIINFIDLEFSDNNCLLKSKIENIKASIGIIIDSSQRM